MKFEDWLFPIIFLLIMFIFSMGVNVLVWVFLVPFILLSWHGTWRGLLINGSITVLLSGMFWFDWLRTYNLVLYIVIVLSWFLFFILFGISIRLARKRLMLSLVIPPLAWYCLTVIIASTMVGEQWINFAIFQPTMAPLIWFVGGRGILILIVTFNTLVALLLLTRSKKIMKALWVLTFLIAACVIFSDSIVQSDKKIKTAIIQAYYPQTWRWRCANAEHEILDKYVEMSMEVARLNKPDVVIWPEYAIPLDLFRNEIVRNRLVSLAKTINTPIVLGALSWKENQPDSKAPRYDQAIIISSKGEIAGTYESVLPVPYGEDVLLGNKIEAIECNGTKWGTMICYEEMSHSTAGHLSNDGAEVLISLANNNSFTSRRGLRLASLFTRLRAAENRKFLVRATNTGLSQVVSPRGKVIASAPVNERDILVVDISPHKNSTFYTKHKDLITICALLLGVICEFGKRRMKFSKMNESEAESSQ